MLTTTYTVGEEGITVPYPPKFNDVQRNSGFVDARGRPDLAAQIPELSQSPALRSLMIALAQPGNANFSIGCDLGSHEQPDDRDAPYVAGGYVQIARANFYSTSAPAYLAQARTITQHVNQRSSDEAWKLEHVCTSVRFLIDGHDEILPSLWIWFFASAKSDVRALESRERLIVALHEAIEQASDS